MSTITTILGTDKIKASRPVINANFAALNVDLIAVVASNALKANLASPTFTGTVVLPSTTSIGTVSNTEIGYLDGVTSAVQTQIDLKAALASPTFTGTPTLPTGTIATTQAALDSSTKVATTAFVMGEKRGYTVQFGATQNNPADATTYYFGSYQGTVAGDTTEGHNRIYIPKAGTVKVIYIHISNAAGTAGTSETSTFSFRLNATTDTAIATAATNAAANNVLSNTGLSIAVVVGDFFEIKWVTPTWATNPTNLRVMGVVYIE